jgi:rhomboid-like protein
MFYFDTRSAVFNLILLNILFYVLTLFSQSVLGIDLYRSLGLFYFGSPEFKPIQLFTHMFMHANLLHIFSNMYALFVFGAILERFWGPKRFLIFYFLTGLGAEFLHLAVQAWQVYNFTGSIFASQADVMKFYGLQEIYFIPTVGASGAVFGLLAAFGMLFPHTELMLIFPPIPIKAKVFVAIYIVWELYRGISMQPGDNIAHFAHLGGALMGFLLVKYWNRDNRFLF